jgi:electron transfer flavoprotein alpha subunit
VRIAALVKQIPAFEEMTLGADRRLVRAGIDLELNAYCRRAVSKAVEVAADAGGTVVVLTLGPPAAEEVLREAVAWGRDRGVDIRGVLVTDPAFAGSDTLATARAMAAALEHEGPFDLVLTGRNSVDADTGQVPPEVAELLDLPFAGGVRHMEVDGDHVHLRCERDDGWVDCTVQLPALLSCAERLCEPSKVDPDGRAAVPAARIRRLAAADLGPGPWGQAGSPTWVGDTRVHEVARARERRPDLPLSDQVRAAVETLSGRGALTDTRRAGEPPVPATVAGAAPLVAVACEPDRDRHARELLGAAATLASELGGSAAAVVAAPPADVDRLASYGADHVVEVEGAQVEEDVARAVTDWIATLPEPPWAVLTGSTMWGREVASRIAARLDAGLTGDAVSLDVGEDGRLVAWKPAFGGQLFAAITATSAVQLATVRAGMLPTRPPRTATATRERVRVTPRGRVVVTGASRDDDLDILADADVVIGVGRGVHPDEYPALEALRQLLGAELAATRKVTDEGWMPRARQVGITGRSIAPRLFVSIGASGKFNHTVGVRGAETVLAINPDPSAPIWEHADVGIVGDWHEVLPLLVDELRTARAEGG